MPLASPAPGRASHGGRFARDIGDLPRERLIAYGGQRVTTVELLAVIVGAGTRGCDVFALAEEILARVGGVARLARTAPRELVAVPGIGLARATRIAAGFELSRRALEASVEAGQVITSPGEVYRRVRPLLCGLSQEVFLVLALDARNVITDVIEVARGSLTHVEVHPREVFRPLIRQSAAAAIVAHNHPSGDVTPSPDDVALTHRLCAAGDLLGIPLLDHIVVGDRGYSAILGGLDGAS